MKLSLLPLALASVLSLAAFGCAAHHDAADLVADGEVHSGAKSVKATTEPRFELLGGVWKVTGIDNKNNIDLKVIEFGGGDPALNGNQLFLSAWNGDHGGGGVFELHQNINTFTKAEMTGTDTVVITGTYDTIDDKTGDIKSGLPFTSTVKLSVTAKDVGTTATLTRDGNTDTVTAFDSKDEGHGFFSELFDVRQEESKGGHLVRLYETGGGDPAMNGDQLVLNVMAYPEEKSYDLGINVNTVTKFALTGENEARIEGTEDYMNAQSGIKNRPFAYNVKFSIAGDGKPADAVTVTRVQ